MRKQAVLIGMVSFLVTAGVLCLAVGIHYWREIPIQLLTRDPAASTGEEFYLGAVSNYGMILWSGALTASLLAAVVLGSGEAKAGRHFFIGGGSLTALLLVDDFYMLHERVFPTFLGIPEKVLLTIEAAVFLVLILVFRDEFRRSGTGLLFLAVLGFGASLAIDRIHEARLGPWHYLCEDGAKLLGITGWFSFWVSAAAFRLGPSLLRPVSSDGNVKDVGKRKNSQEPAVS